MSIVSTVPHSTTKEQKCPRCDNVYPIENTPPAGATIECNSCAQVFQICSSPSHHHVRQSDGDRHQLSMITQKRSQLILRNSHRLWKNSLDDHESHAQRPTETRTTTTKPHRPQPNLGVSLLKHIVVNFSSDPIDLANAIEDLLDHLITISHDPELSNDTNTQQLRIALALIRNEALRTTELNYLDFRDEHKQFMTITQDIIAYLSQRIQAEQTKNPTTTLTRNQTTVFSSWVFHHYSRDLDISTIANSNNSTLILSKNLTGRLRCYRISLTTTISQLKTLIAAVDGIPPTQQYLVYNGRKLEDWYTAAHYGLGPKFYVHILLSIWKDNIVKGRSGRSVEPYQLSFR